MSNQIIILSSPGSSVGSVTHCLDRLNLGYTVTNSPESIARAKLVILPGNGNIGTAYQLLLHDPEIKDALIKKSASHTGTVLGICLGMHVLGSYSEEGGGHTCFNLISGRAQIIPTFKDQKYCVPNIGWSTLESSTNLLAESDRWRDLIRPQDNFYFSHSYQFCCGDSSSCLFISHEPPMVPAIVIQNNAIGVQFHPERSGSSGRRFMRLLTDECIN